MVAITLLLEHSIEQKVVLKCLCYDLLIGLDALSDLIESVWMIMQEEHRPFEPLSSIHLVNKITSFALEHGHICFLVRWLFLGDELR